MSPVVETQYLRSQPTERIPYAAGLAKEVQKPLKNPFEEDFPQSLQNNTGWSLSRTLR